MMNYFALSLLLGLLVIPVVTAFPPGSCDGYTNITQSWRNRAYIGTWFPGNDQQLLGKWSRFTGIGGDRVIIDCVPYYHGGAGGAIYISAPYPTTESLTPTTVTAYGYYSQCPDTTLTVNIALCPGGFYVYQPLSYPYNWLGYVTYHYDCKPDSCGPLAKCMPDGGCNCEDGYKIPNSQVPTPDSFGCVDIDECQRTTGICGPYSNCKNTDGSYICTCLNGFSATDPTLPPETSNQCADINECLANICGQYGSCLNQIGSYVCSCNEGFHIQANATPVCQDNDECLTLSICGSDSICTNTPGAYTCACRPGYAPTDQSKEPSETNICTDIDECANLVLNICGANCNCTNSIGSYNCTCLPGYRVGNPDVIASIANPCNDIDECSETPGLCGNQTVCTNVPGTFYCSCPDGFYPSTGVVWKAGITFCKSLEDILDEIKPNKEETKERAFLDHMGQDLRNNTGVLLPDMTVANCFSSSMEVSGAGTLAGVSKVSSQGDGETGSVILGLSEQLVVAMTPTVTPTEEQIKKEVHTSTVDLTLLAIGPLSIDNKSSSLSAKGYDMKINLNDLARANNGSISVAFLTLNGMESILSHQYFQTNNVTEMYSDVLTAIIPGINTTNLTEPVNFTIQHKEVPENGMVTCVYWKDGLAEGGQKGETMRWSEEGCWVSYSHKNYTVCSCSHLSTFALILQIGEPVPQNNFLDWLNRMCVMVGLFFLGLAIVTFLLCSWNPKINNTARLHLCLNLAFSQLLLLWNDKYTDNKLACTVMAGLLHFLIVASFVWMWLEALQLHLLVRRLSQVKVIQRDGLPRPILYLVGYGVPFVIVGVSALIYSGGYGRTEANVCWLSENRNFKWALTGPVIAILALNCILFGATLWSLRPTLANIKSDISQSKDTTLILFKILAQFVILGCTWILGLYQTNLFFQVAFIILNSQQGTFLYIVHCVLNKEIRDEYVKWLTCSFNTNREGGSVKNVPSSSEDLDIPQEQTG